MTSERPNSTKPFAVDPDYLEGASINDIYDSNEDFKQAKNMHNLCMLYATAYNETMLQRLEKEKPEFYEENNINKRELVAHLTNNMCLAYTKYKSKVFRDTTAQLKEKEHLNEQIRRLNNGGDRFHPYF
jgi:hypothetical protein